MKRFAWILSSVVCCALHADAPKTKPVCSFDTPTFDRGDKALENCPSGYNLPAQVHLDGRDYQGFITASYLFWNPQQDGMEVATTAIYNGAVVRTDLDGQLLSQGTPYKSGFKVGLGYNFEYCDQWTLRADYTRLHQSNTSNFTAPHTSVGTGVLYSTNWFFQTAANQNLASTSLTSTWHLGLDLLDVSMTRAFYQGKKWTVTSFGGLRASWISQSFNVSLTDLVNASASQVSSHNSSSSWGLGPRAGMEGRFLLGMGFRLQGSAGGSLLFTQFTDISHTETAATLGGKGVTYGADNVNCVRPMVEGSMGFGWGSYFSRNRYHIDLSMTYDFNYMWKQNMVGMLNEAFLINSPSSGIGDLSLQGMTLSCDFYF